MYLLFFYLTNRLKSKKAEVKGNMIGERIRTLREAHQMSGVQLAKKLCVSKQSVSNWECNNIMPSAEQIKRIAQLFGCTTDYLLDLDRETSIVIEQTDLSKEQAAHILQLINDLKEVNRKLKK